MSRHLPPDGPGFDQRLTEAFRRGLDLPAEADVTMLAFGQHQHWDSLGHMSLVVALEDAFGVTLSEQDVLDIDSFASAAGVLRGKKHAGS